MSPERIALLIRTTRSERIFNKEVLPAPEEPIIYVAIPGAANPEQSFETQHEILRTPDKSFELITNLMKSKKTILGII